MPVCATGSHAKPSTPAWLVLGIAALEVLVTRRVPWLGPFVGFLVPAAIDTSDFCAAEPPEFPAFTPADLGLLFAGGATAKLTQAAQHVLWYEFCECNSPEATPAIPFQAPPADIPVIAPSPLGACDNYSKSTDVNSGIWFGTVHSGGTAITGGRPLPIGATHQTLSAQVVSNPGDDILTLELQVTYANESQAVTSTRSLNMFASGAPRQESAVVAIPAGSTQWVATFKTTSSQSGPLTLIGDVTTHCGGSPIQLQAPCCPPDPALSAKLDSLVELVTAMQRQAVPFAYVPGVVTGGLEDNGQVALSGPSVAVSLLLTTVPGHYGMAEGDPDRIFDVGWLARGTPDGFESPRRITTSPFYLRLGGEHTRIGYALAPGVVGELREHLGEP